MFVDMPLFRPPSEAHSLILQVTLGCSHNRCAFCSMYLSKRFTVRRQTDLQRDIDEARAVLGSDVPRIFLADGDAFCLSPRRLHAVLRSLRLAFPGMRRVSAYANARDINAKSDVELRELAQAGLTLLYLGLESGDDVTLTHIDKGASADEMVRAVVRAQAAGIRCSVMVLIGLAGKERSEVHARMSAGAINRMAPAYTALLTYTPVPGTPFFEELARGDIQPIDAEESLREIRTFLSELSCTTYFTCNHASNYLPLRGNLPRGRESMLDALDRALRGELALKPEFMRGL